MRILFLIRSLSRGGAERQIVNLANGLAARGHEVHLATFYPGDELESEVASAVNRHCLRKQGRWDLVRFLYRLRSLVKELRPDILHSFMPTSNVVAVLASWGLRCRIVWGVRASSMDYSRYAYGVTAAVLELCAAKLSWCPALIVANSIQGHQLMLDRGFPKEKSVVIPNGIDIERFRPRESERERLREKFRFDSHQFIIGVVARLDPMKGHAVFVEAFEAVLRVLPEARAVFVGNGPEGFVQEITTMLTNRRLDHALTMIRDCHNTAEVLPMFDVVVSSSIFGEGFSNSIGEAMASGIPCIVSDVGDSALIVGDSSLVVPPNAPQALADAIVKFLAESEEIRIKRGHLARQRIEKNFSLENLLNLSEQAYHSLMRQGDLE
jgi:glycosyltransferase involved in cell wall biosynthesis